ncbi:MAG: hypothetical protein EXR72_09350 [Myxococcales bacterium]|nr:hypothetical protein [Myxococcales bacterium]
MRRVICLWVLIASACGTMPKGGRDSAIEENDLAVDEDLAGPKDLGEPRDLTGPKDLTLKPDLSKGCGQPCQAPTPVCDLATGECVACLPAMDMCVAGSYCAPAGGTFMCVPGCKIDKDCPASTPDGGAPPKMACCNHQCVDLNLDFANCGKCAGACAKICCGGACVDTVGDPKNCGKCGLGCVGGANAMGVSCVQSLCVLVGCKAPFADCNMSAADGCEADTTKDPINCKGCGKFCDFDNAMAACSVNGCVLQACYQGFSDCNKNPVDGCEAAVTKDPKNCGMCAKVCGAPPSAMPGCFAGACNVGGCVPLFGDCDGNINNGCETPLAADNKNCGACGKPCAPANGTGACLNGMCTVAACTAPFADCDMDPANGCEANLDTNTMHCSKCGMKCVMANSLPICTKGVCSFTACNPGFHDCNGDPNDGCESDPKVDPKNCGGCGKKCSANHVPAPLCAASVCTGLCENGFEDCNADKLTDGCEKMSGVGGGNCAHSPCLAGVKLTAGCDPGGCVAKICMTDPFCCNNSWDGACVGEVVSVCKLKCGCF